MTTTAAQHTPGPWTVQVGTDGVAAANHLQTEIAAPNGRLIARTDSQSLDGRGIHARAEEEANARLIAAAPKMLAVLERLALTPDDLSDVLDDAAAAIAEARGQ